MKTIKVIPAETSRVNSADLENPGFGRLFSDHMFEMEYREGRWQNPVIKPYGKIEVTPALHVFHYGQAVFEGTKAYFVDEKTVHLFRPGDNLKRLNKSCYRMCIPELETGLVLEAVEQLIKIDKNWVPRKEGTALYIRPVVIAFDHFIAARSADQYRFYIITSPVGDYYTGSVALTTSPKYIRAAKGGTGEAKAAGNYAAGMLPAKIARQQGYDQVLWLDALEHRYVEEVGTMNIFFVIENTIVTPALSGSILPGITRDSILTLAKSWGLKIAERRISIEEVMQAGQGGVLQEIFGSGTAAVISPVKAIHHEGVTVRPEEAGRGLVGERLYKTITGIQTGRLQDTYGWIYPVKIR